MVIIINVAVIVVIVAVVVVVVAVIVIVVVVVVVVVVIVIVVVVAVVVDFGRNESSFTSTGKAIFCSAGRGPRLRGSDRACHETKKACQPKLVSNLLVALLNI